MSNQAVPAGGAPVLITTTSGEISEPAGFPFPPPQEGIAIYDPSGSVIAFVMSTVGGTSNGWVFGALNYTYESVLIATGTVQAPSNAPIAANYLAVMAVPSGNWSSAPFDVTGAPTVPSITATPYILSGVAQINLSGS